MSGSLYAALGQRDQVEREDVGHHFGDSNSGQRLRQRVWEWPSVRPARLGRGACRGAHHRRLQLFVAWRKERADAAAESKRHDVEVRRAARLIDDDLHAAAPGSDPCTRCWTPPPRAAGWSSTSSRPWPSSSGDSSWRGSRCSTPRPGSTARQRRCWPGLPRTGRPGPRKSRRPVPGAPCRRRPRSHATSDPRFSGWYGGRPRHSLICCWMTSGAGRASTV
jgi:hypothetical protein